MESLLSDDRQAHERYLQQYTPLLREYVDRKLREEGDEWLWNIVFPGEGFIKLPGLDSIEQRLASARLTAESMLGISGPGGKVKVWLREWPTDYGLKELRAGVERLVNPRRVFSDETRDRYNDCYVHSGFSTHDAFMNHLLKHYYQQKH